MNQIDFIGDIHGHSEKLKALLLKMGYTTHGKAYRHPHRKAFFVGDFIDRGPDSPEVIKIVRNMVDNGDALAVAGNHEYNAICFNTLTKNGYLRKHSLKNINQHAATMKQFLPMQYEYDDMIQWFKTLPLFYESECFRVVHATWDKTAIGYLENHTNNGVLPHEKYLELSNTSSELNKSIEVVLKGKETRLPYGKSFRDKDGTIRFDTRIKWWQNPKFKTLKEMSIIEDLDISDILFTPSNQEYYNSKEKPVFFGHYWLNGTPELIRHNVCCLDYSVAKGGVLCAYRYDGENKLDKNKLLWV